MKQQELDHWADLVVIILYFVFVMGVGLWVWYQIANVKLYLDFSEKYKYQCCMYKFNLCHVAMECTCKDKINGFI